MMTTTNCCGKCAIKCRCMDREKHPWRCGNAACVCHTKKASIKIVPSGRWDWCGDCKKEHGYDCPLDTPNPLTAAIEEAQKRLSLLKGHDGYADGETVARLFGHFIAEKMQQAYALGKQEGMEEGAASAVRYVQKNILSIDTNDINAPTLQVSTEKLEELLEAARTAHRGDGGKEA